MVQDTGLHKHGNRIRLVNDTCGQLRRPLQLDGITLDGDDFSAGLAIQVSRSDNHILVGFGHLLPDAPNAIDGGNGEPAQR